MKIVLTINEKATDIVLAERKDKNYKQLEIDARLPFAKVIDSIQTGYVQDINYKIPCCLWSDGKYYATEIIE